MCNFWGPHHSFRSLRLSFWYVLFVVMQFGLPAFAMDFEGLNHQQFKVFSSRDIDVQLDGKGGNRINRYGTYSPTMEQAPNELREIILFHERKQPSAHTVNVQVLAKCKLISTGLELDNIRGTQEWLVTTQDSCNSVSPFGLKTFWLLQRSGTGTVVLMTERGQKRVFISKKANSSGYRSLSLRIINGQVRIETRSGMREYKAKCKPSWKGEGGRYVRHDEGIEIWAKDPITNSHRWLSVQDAFQGRSVKLPKACLRI